MWAPGRRRLSKDPTSTGLSIGVTVKLGWNQRQYKRLT